MNADNVVHLHPVREDENGSHEIKPGEYLALYVRHQGMTIFKCNKVRVDFRLVEHPEIVLERWYRVSGYRGRISAPSKSAIVREMRDVFGRGGVRRDQIPISALANVPVRVDVTLVTRDQEQEPLSEVNQYVKIGRVKGRA